MFFRCCRPALVAALFYLSASEVSAAPWSFENTWSTPLGAFNAYIRQSVGDLDGDGRNEILFSQSYTSQGQDARDFHGFLVLGQDAHGDWGMRDLRFVAGKVHNTPVFDAGPAQRAYVGTSEQDADGNWSTSLDVFAGLPLQRVRRVPLEGNAEPLAVADIDGDGADELLVVDGQPYRLRLRDLETFSLLQEFDMFSFEAIAQLDEDPALEIIGNNSNGVVLDGATGEAEWNYASEFYSTLFAGEFDGNPATREFAAVRFDDVVVFGSNPYAPMMTFPIPCDAWGTHRLIEADADNGAEFAFVCPDDIAIVDPQAGLLRNVAAGEVAYGVVTVAALDDDPAPELLLNRFRTELQSALILDSVTEDRQFRLDEVNDGAMPVGSGDFAGDGRASIAVVTAGPMVQDPATLWILDAGTGSVLRSARIKATLDWQQQTASMAVAQLDDDPALELVLGTGLSHGTVVALDGATLEQEWIAGHPLFPDGVGTVRVADIDGDGAVDVVVSSGRHATVLGHAGALRWQTADGDASVRVTVTQADADPALELLLWSETGVTAIDGATRLADWSTTFPTSTWYEGLLVIEDDEGCSMLVYRSNGAAADARCGSNAAWTEFSFDAEARWLGQLPGRDDLLLAVLDQRLALVTRRGVRVAEAGFVAPSWGEAMDSLRLTAEPGTGGEAYRIVAGGEGAVWTVRLALAPTFGDGFESDVSKQPR